MARLIIGHTTTDSVCVWARGDREHPFAFVKVRAEDGSTKPTKMVELEERHFWTGAEVIGNLEAATEYTCEVRFGAEHDEPEQHRVDFGHCTGRFRTFPRASAPGRMTFLLGSCNLHTLGPVVLPQNPAYRRLSELAADNSADFMIHCGDQIYYDVPAFSRSPDIDKYRGSYLDAWRDSRATRKFLTELPHYMILDDHEMTDNFANDMEPKGGATPRQFRDASLKVYREFVHIRQPNSFGRQALYYEFSCGKYPFFILDTRSERFSRAHNGGESCIIGGSQMEAFKDWLLEHASAVKFAVTSVPFVSRVHSDDKWSSDPYERQREELIDFIGAEEIGGIVFLTGDMHNAHQAVMDIQTASATVRVHELMSSPINQIGKRSIDRYQTPETGRTDGTQFKTSISKFYAEHSNAMVIKAEDRKVSWQVYRTKKRVAPVRRGSFTV